MDLLNTLDKVIDPAYSALMVIDPQEIFCSSKSVLVLHKGLDTSRIEAAIPRLNKFIKACRKYKIPLFWTKQIYTKDKMHANQKARWLDKDGNIWLCREHHPEIDWYYKVEKPIEGEPIISKWAYDVFQDTNLHLQLQCKGIKTLLLTGFTTECCVETAARRGYHLGYHIVAVYDCIDTYKKSCQESFINNIEDLFGHVASSEDVIKILKNK